MKNNFETGREVQALEIRIKCACALITSCGNPSYMKEQMNRPKENLLDKDFVRYITLAKRHGVSAEEIRATALQYKKALGHDGSYSNFLRLFDYR